MVGQSTRVGVRKAGLNSGWAIYWLCVNSGTLFTLPEPPASHQQAEIVSPISRVAKSRKSCLALASVPNPCHGLISVLAQPCSSVSTCQGAPPLDTMASLSCLHGLGMNPLVASASISQCVIQQTLTKHVLYSRHCCGS